MFLTEVPARCWPTYKGILHCLPVHNIQCSSLKRLLGADLHTQEYYIAYLYIIAMFLPEVSAKCWPTYTGILHCLPEHNIQGSSLKCLLGADLHTQDYYIAYLYIIYNVPP